MTSKDHHNKISLSDVKECRGKLLEWYDGHDREVPWRVDQGRKTDPYKIWLSEIMCQQTTVGAVKAYYAKFINRWPDVHTLAAAPQDEIMAAWAGLGYYARARNLHKCAQIVSVEYDGEFPQAPEMLKKLPGIGEYTAAAIAAIAFNKPTIVVDGNVERVIARFYAVEEPMPKAKSVLKKLAGEFYGNNNQRPGDLAQAFMDLGANICLPKIPRCPLCPINKFCIGFSENIAAELPRKSLKLKRPIKRGYVYWIKNRDNRVLFVRRPPKGLLGGMLALPDSSWEEDISEIKPLYPHPVNELEAKIINHTFTHFDLQLTLIKLDLENSDLTLSRGEYGWYDPLTCAEQVPTLYRKAIDIAINQ